MRGPELLPTTYRNSSRRTLPSILRHSQVYAGRLNATTARSNERQHLGMSHGELHDDAFVWLGGRSGRRVLPASRAMRDGKRH